MDDGTERQLNIHLDPEQMAGVYANFANVTFSAYEFTITFARVDHEVDWLSKSVLDRVREQVRDHLVDA